MKTQCCLCNKPSKVYYVIGSMCFCENHHEEVISFLKDWVGLYRQRKVMTGTEQSNQRKDFSDGFDRGLRNFIVKWNKLGRSLGLPEKDIRAVVVRWLKAEIGNSKV